MEPNIQNEPNWDYLFWAWDQEEKLKNANRITDRELMGVFPEAKTLLPHLLNGWRDKRSGLIQELNRKLRIIKFGASNESDRFFWTEWFKVKYQDDIAEADKNINRLKRLVAISNNDSQISRDEDRIESALAIPITSVIQIKLRKSGNKLSGLCPLHNDKSPPFFIYPESNSFYCYGCNKGGNVINLVRFLYDYTFPNAIKFLNNL